MESSLGGVYELAAGWGKFDSSLLFGGRAGRQSYPKPLSRSAARGLADGNRPGAPKLAIRGSATLRATDVHSAIGAYRN